MEDIRMGVERKSSDSVSPLLLLAVLPCFGTSVGGLHWLDDPSSTRQQEQEMHQYGIQVSAQVPAVLHLITEGMQNWFVQIIQFFRAFSSHPYCIAIHQSDGSVLTQIPSN